MIIKERSNTTRTLILLIAALLIVSCSPAVKPTCAEQAADYLNGLTDIETRWDGALATALASSRLGLDEPIVNLQEIQREASDLLIPSCDVPFHAQALQTKIKLVIYMIDVIVQFKVYQEDPGKDIHGAIVGTAGKRQLYEEEFTKLEQLQ